MDLPAMQTSPRSSIPPTALLAWHQPGCFMGIRTKMRDRLPAAAYRSVASDLVRCGIPAGPRAPQVGARRKIGATDLFDALVPIPMSNRG